MAKSRRIFNRPSVEKASVSSVEPQGSNRRWIVYVGAAAGLAGVVATVVSVLGYINPRAPKGEIAAGSLALTTAENNQYYPLNGVLPTEAPPPHEHSERFDHCFRWEAWAKTIGAAPDVPSVDLRAIASVSSPLTILNVRPLIFGREPTASLARLTCGFQAGGVAGTTLTISLDDPAAKTRLDIDADGTDDDTLPGGRVVIESQNAEDVTISLEGTPGYVYSYGLRFEIVENGVVREETYGTREQPLRMLFEDEAVEPAKHTWDGGQKKWVPAVYPEY